MHAQGGSCRLLRISSDRRVGKGGIEGYVAREQLADRTHQWIEDVIADPADVSITNQLALVDLLSRATYQGVVRIRRRKAHFLPGSECLPPDAITPRDIVLVGAIVVKKVELDELDTLIFQI